MKPIWLGALLLTSLAATTTPAVAQNYEAKLVKKGAVAPDFSKPKPNGGTLNLKKSLGKRATIVNFWFYG